MKTNRTRGGACFNTSWLSLERPRARAEPEKTAMDLNYSNRQFRKDRALELARHDETKGTKAPQILIALWNGDPWLLNTKGCLLI